jgi:hypothetical protein
LKPHEKLVKTVNALGLTVYSVKVVRECAEV